MSSYRCFVCGKVEKSVFMKPKCCGVKMRQTDDMEGSARLDLIQLTKEKLLEENLRLGKQYLAAWEVWTFKVTRDQGQHHGMIYESILGFEYAWAKGIPYNGGFCQDKYEAVAAMLEVINPV